MTKEEAIKIIKSQCYIANLLDLDRTQMVNTALDTVIEAAEQTRWIPCSERLPKADEYVGDVAKYYLVQNEYGDMLVARYTHSGYWEQIYQLKPIGDEVIAWRELPQPYKAKKAVDIMHDVINAENIPYEGTDDR
jgi:hypothetical protein